MPPKSSSNRKSTAAASWYHCEVCDVHLTAPEREKHDKVCPIKANNDANCALEYVKDGVLYTTSVERRSFTIDELKEHPAKYVNNFLFMSEGAMRLAKFHIGQNVVIKGFGTHDGLPLIRSIWPVPEKFLTTLFVSDEDFNLNWSALKGHSFKVQQLPNNCAPPAKILSLKLQTDAALELSMKDVGRVLKGEIKQLIFTKNSCIHLNFFNKTLTFKVIDWRKFEHEQDENTTEIEQSKLLEKLEQLNINEFKDNDEFFQVTNRTCIEIDDDDNKCGKSSVENVDENKYRISKADIGGLGQQLNLIEETMDYALGFRVIPKGVKISRGLLLYGSTGCGKSMICAAMSTALREKSTQTKAHIVTINSSELFSKFLGETEKNLALHFEKAFTNYPQPTFIIIEDVHNLCPKHESNEVTKRVAIAFLSMLDSLGNKQEAQRTFLLATTSQIEALNPSIRRCGRLDYEVEIGAPSPKARNSILQCLLRNVENSLTMADIEEIAQVTHGFVGADLANLIYNSSLHALKSQNNTAKLAVKDVHASLLHIKPSAMREVLIENPNIHWTDIGGQAELKLKLQQAIEWPLLHPEKFKRLGIKPPRGILMFGPPGCSKTMIAKALATESQLNFLSIKGPELFSMWVGESERAVREVFSKARQVAPAIVFFDEIDAIGGERAEAGAGTSVKERVLTQLLTELDGVEALQDVTIVAATNRPDMIDKALLRPGRIDRIIYVGLPDAEARREIFRIKLHKMPLAHDVQLDELVKRTDGYTGAEIQAVCNEAALKTLEQDFNAEQVALQHFEYALNMVQPRTSPELLHLYEEYLKKS